MKEAMIMDIQRFSIHDGPGIRTTVFFKGCHMSCKWCHNPESWYTGAEMLFYQEHCVQCQSCLSFCEKGAHLFTESGHQMKLTLCRDCDRMEACAKSCPAEAMRVCGQKMGTREVLEKVLIDRDFYGEEGGVTCSGGETLLQTDFLQEFLPLCKEEGISTCLDTTLNVEWEKIEPLLPFADLFLADIKFMDREQHKRFTGRDGTLTIENLQKLSLREKPVILRMPLLSGINDTEAEIAARKGLLKELTNVQRVDCFAVTGHGAAKYRALQREMVSFNQGQDFGKIAERVHRELMGNGE